MTRAIDSLNIPTGARAIMSCETLTDARALVAYLSADPDPSGGNYASIPQPTGYLVVQMERVS